MYVLCCADEGRGAGDGSILLRLMEGRFVLRWIRMCLLEEAGFETVIKSLGGRGIRTVEIFFG